MVSTIDYGNVEEEGQDVKYNSEMLQLRCGAGGAETMFGHVLVVRNANLLTYLYYFCEREAPFRRMMVLKIYAVHVVPAYRRECIGKQGFVPHLYSAVFFDLLYIINTPFISHP